MKTAIAYLHTHFDFEWYKTADSFNVRLVEIFDKVLEELKKENIPCFYFDGQVLALLNYLKFRPEKENLIKKLIKEKKLFIGPFFASPDNLLISGASLVKNLELGIKISKKFNENEFIGYLSDTFGHSKGIFEILKLFDIDNVIIWRGVGDLPSDFIANGIKTTRLVYGYYQDVLQSDLPVIEKSKIIENVLDKINEFSNDTLLLPLGADHMGIKEKTGDLIKEINKHLKNYKIKLSNPFEYFKKTDFSKFEYEGEFLDNSNTFILSGVYSARIPEKAVNAQLQHELFYKTAVLNYFLGKKYNKELDIASIELIKNHAHDSIYGCSTDEVHNYIRLRQLSVFETVNTVNKMIKRDFKKENLIKENNNNVLVFNTSKYPQDGVLKVVTDKKIKFGQKIKTFKFVSDEIFYDPLKCPVTEDFHNFYEYLIETDSIKPFSHKNFEIKKPEIKHILSDDFIENDRIKLFVLDNKIYVTDKTNGETYPDFIELQTTKDGGDSYNYAPLEYPKKLKLVSSKVKTKGMIESVLELKFEENIKLNVSIGNKTEYLKFEAEFVNKKKNRCLQIVFNTNSPIQKTIAEDSIGTIERNHDPNYLLFENMPAPKRKELKTNSYPMQRFVQANGVGVITLGLNEYEIYKNSLKITLLRSTGIISNPKNQARSVPAGPPIECVDMQCLGKQNLKFALTFNNDLKRLADNFYNPFTGLLGEFKTKNKTYIKTYDEDSEFLGIVEIKGLKAPLFL